MGKTKSSKSVKASEKKMAGKGARKEEGSEMDTHTYRMDTDSELSGLAGLAMEMEEQLLQEFEALVARRRQQQEGSKGNGPEEAQPSGANLAGPSGDNDPLYWKHMYERLRDLRETEAEKLLREGMQRAEEQEAAHKELIGHLQKELERARGGAPAEPAKAPEQEKPKEGGGQTGAPVVGANAAEAMRALEAKVARLKRQLLGYQRLTSLCLALEQEPHAPGQTHSTLSCTAINHVHQRAVKFQLRLNCEEAQSQDSDALFRPLANLELLPPFLQQEVEIESKQLPMLLLAVLKTLYHRESH